jgi:hypothetical protein
MFIIAFLGNLELSTEFYVHDIEKPKVAVSWYYSHEEGRETDFSCIVL